MPELDALTSRPTSTAGRARARLARRAGRAAGLALTALLCLPAGQAAAGPQEEIIVRREPGLSAAQRADVRADAAVALDRMLAGRDTELVAARPGDRADALADLRADPDVLWAEPNRPRHAQSLNREQYGDVLLGLRNRGAAVLAGAVLDADVDADEAWRASTGAGVTVAVVDSGVDAGHPDLASRMAAGGRDLVGRDDDPADLNGHGTHVAGTIAGARDGGGVVGVAPDARVVALRALGARGDAPDAPAEGTCADSGDAILRAGELGVRAVNASFGAGEPCAYEQAAIRAHPEVLVVAAAGNDGQDVDDPATGMWPCAYPEPNVICVGASGPRDERASFSNAGARSVDLFAPGSRILSAWPLALPSSFETGYVVADGTSMAAPHVTGAVALVASAHPEWTAARIKDVLLSSVDRPAALSGLSVSGGRLNAARAVGVTPAPPDGTRPGAPAQVRAVPAEAAVRISWAVDPDADTVRVRWSTGSGTREVRVPAADQDVTITGLTVAAEYTFALAATDLAGNVSDAVPVTATAGAPAPTPPTAPTPRPERPTAVPAPVPAPLPPSAPVVLVPPPRPAPAAGRPAPAPARPAAPRLLSARVTGEACPGSRCAARPAQLRISLSAPGAVTVQVERRVCVRHRCAWRPARRTRIAAPAGTRSVPVARLAGPLAAGPWRAVVTGPAGDVRTAPFAVRAR